MTDSPLAQLEPDAQQALAELGESLAALDSDERGAVAELAQARASGDLSRRQLLQAAGALGVGALAGGGGAAALTGSAAADASATDSDPDVGEPGDRVDGFFDGVDSTSVRNKNYVEPQATASSGSSYTADLAAANYHKVTLTGDVSFDFANTAASDTNSVVMHLVQDGTGGRTPSFTPTVIWDGGLLPDWSTAANAEDVVTLMYDQDGSQWLGFVGGVGMA